MRSSLSVCDVLQKFDKCTWTLLLLGGGGPKRNFVYSFGEVYQQQAI